MGRQGADVVVGRSNLLSGMDLLARRRRDWSVASEQVLDYDEGHARFSQGLGPQ
jgi:hypothetical protein